MPEILVDQGGIDRTDDRGRASHLVPHSLLRSCHRSGVDGCLILVGMPSFRLEHAANQDRCVNLTSYKFILGVSQTNDRFLMVY